jgi:hypothetical protein
MEISAGVSEADSLVKDGKIDPKEFFAFYVGCSQEEAARAFSRHAPIFADLEARGRPIQARLRLIS